MNFSSFKLGAKLGIAFFAVVLLTTAVGGFSLAQLSRLNGNTTDITENWLPGVSQASEFRGALNAMRRADVSLVLATEAKQTEQAQKAYAEAAKRLDKVTADFNAQVSSDSERAMSERMKKDRTRFDEVHRKLSELAAGGEAQFAMTRAFLQGESLDVFNQALETAKTLSKDSEDGVATAAIQAQATYHTARGWIITFVAAAIAMAAVMAVWTTRLITRPVARAVHAAERIAAGDLTVDLMTQGRDETAVLLQTLSSMKDRLANMVGGVRQTAEGVATSSAQIASGNNDLSGRTEQQAGAIEETAASMEQLSSTVKQNADNARQANQLAMGASTVAVQGGEVVGRVVDTMKGINDSSKKIVDIISVIDSIAFQTNILALNAAVEAARAGEQGRGFAVVAGEVRSLAQRSAEAAKEIKKLISDSVERVDQGTALVDQAGVTMQEVVASIRRVTDIMGEISAASAEQSSGVAQVGQAITQMDQTTQQNAALVEQSAAAAESLRRQAQDLLAAVSLFRTSAPESGRPQPTEPPKPAPTPSRKPPAPVVRAEPKPPAAALAAAPVAPMPAPASAASDDWETF